MANKQIPFRPILEGEFKNSFYQIASTINASMSSASVISIAEGEINGVENKCFYNIEQRKNIELFGVCLRI